MPSFIQCLRRSAAVLLMGLATVASAQNFPNRPIKIVVPFGPGGSGDITARAFGSRTALMTLTAPLFTE